MDSLSATLASGSLSVLVMVMIPGKLRSMRFALLAALAMACSNDSPVCPQGSASGSLLHDGRELGIFLCAADPTLDAIELIGQTGRVHVSKTANGLASEYQSNSFPSGCASGVFNAVRGSDCVAHLRASLQFNCTDSTHTLTGKVDAVCYPGKPADAGTVN
jgi:hypothetical protein